MYDSVDLWDAIVVGAGPAGCAAAYDLAVSGKSVLLLDRYDFPRQKACAGGLTIKAVNALRYPIFPVVVRTVSCIRVSKNLMSSTTLSGTKPICLMTVRAELDAFCLRKTVEAGAEFRRATSITALRESNEAVTLSTQEGDFQARFIIGADGANSKVRQLIGETTWFRAGFALEAQVPSSRHTSDMHLDFGVVCDGYGWVFPKDGHLNVGLYSESQKHKITRAGLAEYIRQKLGVDNFEGVIGQYLGMGGRTNQARHRRVLLVGDAAGLVDPITGEGIYNAIVSGQAAAYAIDKEIAEGVPAPDTFQHQLREMKFDLALSERAAKRFYGNLDWGYSALTIPLVRHVALRTYLQGLNFGRALKRYSFVLPYLSRRTGVPVTAE